MKKDQNKELNKELENPDKFEKGEYNKLYSAMTYAKSKGDSEPWAMCKGLTTIEQKREFLSKYMKTKNFSWIRTLKEQQAQRSTSSRTEEAQWLSKIQIADEEKLNMNQKEHLELLEGLLATLPSRPHKVKAWADMGLLEYKYIKDKEIKADSQEHVLQQDQEMKIDEKVHDALANSMFKMVEPSPVPLSLCDRVKEETATIEDKALEYKEGLGKLKKVKRSMDDLAMDFLAQRAKLEEVSNKKSYLKPLLEEACEQYTHYTKGKEEVAELLATLSNEYSHAVQEKLQKGMLLAEAHYEGFKNGTLKEISGVLK